MPNPAPRRVDVRGARSAAAEVAGRSTGAALPLATELHLLVRRVLPARTA